MLEKTVSMAQLIKLFDMTYDNPESLDLSDMGLEVESVNDDGNIEYKQVLDFLVKPKVKSHYELGKLKGTGNHRIKHGEEYVHLKNHPNSKKISDEINVVDISVEDNENYIANGYINHNTTSGGIA